MGYTRRSSNSLDERARSLHNEHDEQENLIPASDPDASDGGTATSGLLKMNSAPTTHLHTGDEGVQAQQQDQSQEGVENEQDEEEGQLDLTAFRP